MPKVVKSEAKKRLLVTEGELRDALLHGHEVVRRLVAVDLVHGVLDRSAPGVSGSTDAADRQRLARVEPLVLARRTARGAGGTGRRPPPASR